MTIDLKTCSICWYAFSWCKPVAARLVLEFQQLLFHYLLQFFAMHSCCNLVMLLHQKHAHSYDKFLVTDYSYHFPTNGKWIRSAKSGSLEYVLRMDMALLFHLSFTCPGSLDNSRHIISGVLRTFHVWP